MMRVKSATNFTSLTFLTDPHGQYGNIICNRQLLSEKTGRKVPEKTAKRINDLENKITTTKELLKQRERAIEATRKDYLYAISRFKLLQEKRRPK